MGRLFWGVAKTVVFEKGGSGRCSPGTKTGMRVHSHVPLERKPERGYVRQNHPFTKPPFCLPVIFWGANLDGEQVFIGAPLWVGRRGLPRFVPISPFSSDLFRFAHFVCRNAPICSNFLRFLPICFQNKSEQIRETRFCRPLLQVIDFRKVLVTNLYKAAREGVHICGDVLDRFRILFFWCHLLFSNYL